MLWSTGSLPQKSPRFRRTCRRKRLKIGALRPRYPRRVSVVKDRVSRHSCSLFPVPCSLFPRFPAKSELPPPEYFLTNKQGIPRDARKRHHRYSLVSPLCRQRPSVRGTKSARRSRVSVRCPARGMKHTPGRAARRNSAPPHPSTGWITSPAWNKRKKPTGTCPCT